MNGVNLGEQFAFGNITSLGQGTNFLVGPVFMIASIGVTFYFIFGAIKYMMAGDDKNNTAAARGMITHAIIGFLLLMLMFLLLQFIPEFFGISHFRIIQ